MTKDDFDSVVRAARERDDATIALKNKDYAGGLDYLANINEAAKDLGLTTTQVVAIHLRKQFSALMRWVREGSLAGEPLESRLTDIRNYCMMLEALAQEDGKMGGFWGYQSRVRDIEGPRYEMASFLIDRAGQGPR